MHAQQMIATHPHVKGSTNEILIRCIEECYACAQSCTACADACLGEDSVKDRHLCRERSHCHAPHGLERADHAGHAADLRCGVRGLRRGVRAACEQARALPHLR
jgi:hypothetical protein